jgi:hypothetical protein
MSYNNGPRIVTNGLVLHLDAGNGRSYPGSGTTWSDLSRNGITGTLTNGPAYSSANGGVLSFDGTNDYVTLGTPALLNQVQVPLSICVWARANSLGTYNTLWGVYKGITSHQLYSLFRVDSGTLRYFASNSSGTYQWQDTFSISTNIWYFYAVTVSGSISSPVVTIYLNNSSRSFSYSAFSSTPDATVDFRVGSNQSAPGECWNGNISQVCWYNRALSAAEIRQNYHATKGRFGL